MEATSTRQRSASVAPGLSLSPASASGSMQVQLRLVSLLSARPNSQEQLLSRQGLYYLVRYSNIRKAVFPSTAETSKAPEVNCPLFSRVPKCHFRAQEFTPPRRSSLELTRLHTKGLSSSRDLQTLHTQGSSPSCLF